MRKAFVVTGAGSGIGRAVAIKLASINNNHQLVLIGRKEGKLFDTLSLIENGNPHIVIPADVSDLNSLMEAIGEHDLLDLNIAGIFANAGIGGENVFGENDRWSEILNTNLTGTYNTIQAFLPYLRKSSELYKNILITSSCLAKFGVPNYTAYCTSKAGLLGLTKSLAEELAPEHILVNAICPGWVNTQMARDGIQSLADHQGITFQKALEQQMKYVPQGKMSEPIEIANLVSFFFNNEQNSMTGQSIDINNGSFMN
ncbi:MAG: NAD(P)-dependent dehydrogenase (short-subunit alcohol dehydrogenase family) [Sphingobacteriales bacterium]|jgi:NAD(P)-dependent dehydrogenase (short-subunit alcohol dehydrogenase family)